MPLLDSPSLNPLISPSAKSSLSFQLIRDIEQLRALAPDWQRLLDDSASAEPMRAPAWLLTWWDVYAANTDRALRVGVFREGDRLIGLAPLCLRRAWHRWLPFTRLEFLGADMDEQDGVCSEYLGLIARAGYEEILAKQFVQEIARGSFAAWHEVVLSALDGEDAMTRMLEAEFRSTGDTVERQTMTTAPYLALPSSWDEYLKGLASKKRYIIRSLRDFETWAGTDWSIEDARTPGELPRGLAILRTLHNERWQADEHSAGAFAAPRFSAFQDAYMPRLLAEGKLDLFWLTVRGEPIAAHYQILANRKVYFYQCGRSMQVPANLRIGIVMFAQAIQRAIRAGLREYDFLGGPAQYKLQLTRTVRPIVSLRIAQPGIRESLRHGTEHAIDWARSARNRYRAWRKPTVVSDVSES
jgi:CelD/BcsL family acetyltransferase involved in cellulose biosynthesis